MSVATFLGLSDASSAGRKARGVAGLVLAAGLFLAGFCFRGCFC